MVEEVEGSQAPVNTREPEVRGQMVVQAVLAGVEGLNIGNMFVDVKERVCHNGGEDVSGGVKLGMRLCVIPCDDIQPWPWDGIDLADT